MSKPDTWMPFFIGDYRKDTARLTCEQHGAYLQLIHDYWVAGPPPDDDAVLARLVGLDIRAWRKHRPIIERYFTVEGGVWRHKRIDAEIAGASERSGKAAAKARAAAEARWERERAKAAETDAQGNATSMLVASSKQCLSNALHLSPVTSLREEEPSRSGGAKRGSRIPGDWQPSDEDRAYAMAQGLGPVEIGRIADDFRDFWKAKAGKDAVKLDWPATWQRWVRTERDRRSPSRQAAPPKRVGFV